MECDDSEPRGASEALDPATHLLSFNAAGPV